MKKRMSSKIIACLLIAGILVGCSNNPTKDNKEPESKEEATKDLDPKKEHKVDDLVSFQIQKMAMTKAIDAPIYTRTMYFSDGKSVLDIVVKVTNISKKEIKLEDLIDGQIKSGATDEKLKTKIESPDRTELLDAYSIQPEESAILHLHVSVYSTDEVPLTLKIGSKEFTFACKVNEMLPEKTFVNYGETITTSEGISMDILETAVTKKVDPSIMDGMYQYYKVQNSNETFIALKLKVTNNGANEKELSKLIGGRLFVNEEGNYLYEGSVIKESSDGKNLEATGAIMPGEEVLVYCLIPIADEKIEMAMEYQLDTIDGTYFVTK